MKNNIYCETKAFLNEDLKVDINFDLVKREFIIGKKNACIFFVDGFIKDDVVLKLLESLMALEEKKLKGIKDIEEFGKRFVSYCEWTQIYDTKEMEKEILSGSMIMLLEGFRGALSIDVREYPARDIAEPSNDKVMRGSRDGFVETLLMNAALIRRRIRDKDLIIKNINKGENSKTDIAVIYHDKYVDREALNIIIKKIENAKMASYSMSQESLSEALIKRKWYNPFPKMRYTDRPDTASASILDGNIIVIVDNSPSVMLLPAYFFDFFQDINDYYFPPITGTYLRFVRMLIFIATLLATPMWLFLEKNPEILSHTLSFVRSSSPNSVPLILQLIIMELLIDGMKLASLNTPDALSNSMSVVAGLLVGDFAVKSGWFVHETVLYMSFVAIANFAQLSFEMGYAIKFMRVLFLILIQFLNGYGFILGFLILFILLYTNGNVSERSYLYPLIPFNKERLSQIFFRKRKENYEKSSQKK